MCPPATATYTLRIITSLFCSASTTASCTHFIAVSKSTISPLRTPRDGAWPTPRILTVPSGRLSPTTTQIFEVPISRPTIKSLLAICFLLSFLHWNRPLHRYRGWTGMRLGRGKCSELRRLMRRKRFHHARLFLRIDRLVDHLRRRFQRRDRNVSLHEQIHRGELLLGIVRIDQKLLEPLQLRVEIVETKRHLGAIFVRHQQAITFRNIDLADLETRLHKAARAQSQQLERGFCFE